MDILKSLERTWEFTIGKYRQEYKESKEDALVLGELARVRISDLLRLNEKLKNINSDLYRDLCPKCASENWNTLYNDDKEDFDFTKRKCRDCYHVRQSPIE